MPNSKTSSIANMMAGNTLASPFSFSTSRWTSNHSPYLTKATSEMMPRNSFSTSTCTQVPIMWTMNSEFPFRTQEARLLSTTYLGGVIIKKHGPTAPTSSEPPLLHPRDWPSRSETAHQAIVLCKFIWLQGVDRSIWHHYQSRQNDYTYISHIILSFKETHMLLTRLFANHSPFYFILTLSHNIFFASRWKKYYLGASSRL